MKLRWVETREVEGKERATAGRDEDGGIEEESNVESIGENIESDWSASAEKWVRLREQTHRSFLQKKEAKWGETVHISAQQQHQGFFAYQKVSVFIWQTGVHTWLGNGSAEIFGAEFQEEPDVHYCQWEKNNRRKNSPTVPRKWNFHFSTNRSGHDLYVWMTNFSQSSDSQTPMKKKQKKKNGTVSFMFQNWLDLNFLWWIWIIFLANYSKMRRHEFLLIISTTQICFSFKSNF